MFSTIKSFVFLSAILTADCQGTITQTDTLEVRNTQEMGRGVFAKRAYRKGELIERTPVIPLPAAQEPKDKSQVLYNYTFGWGSNLIDSAVVLGYGSLYNHSYTPNAYYTPQEDLLCMDFIAYRDIEPGEEIFVNYNRDPTSQKPLWFDTK